MKYSAAMVGRLFWLSETRKTAELLIQEKSINEIKVLAVNENIYQVRDEDRARRIASAIVKRLQSMPNVLVERIASGDIATAKLLVLISIIKTDRLFFEFMHEVYKSAILLGEYIITDRAINTFFDEKKSQSEVVANWVDITIINLKQRYVGILLDAGVIKKTTDVKKIIIPLVDYNLRKQLEDNGLILYLNAVTGEA